MFEDFDKCERCRKCPAIIECVECGTSQRALKMCYECDKSYHQMFDKDAKTHNRIPIKFEAKPHSKIDLQSCQNTYEVIEEQSRAAGFETSPALMQQQRSPLRQKFPQNEAGSPPLRSGRGVAVDTLAATFDQRELGSLSYQQLQAPSRITSAFSNQSHHFVPTMSKNYKANVAATDINLLSPRSSQLEQDDLRMLSATQQHGLSVYQNQQQQVPGSIFKHQYQELRSPTSGHHLGSLSMASFHEQHQIELKQSEAILREIQLQKSYKEQTRQIHSPSTSIGVGQPEAHSDLTTYYQRMAEDYRQKFLDLEREYNQSRLQNSHDIQRTREETESRLNQRHQLEIDEVNRQLREVINQKDYQINAMRQQIQELEINLSREVDQITTLQNLQGNLEKDYKNSFLEFERKQKDNEDRIERLQRDHEYQLSKFERQHDQEKESIKNDYESLLKQVRDEYQTCTNELKTLLDLKSQDNLSLQTQLQEQADKHKKERVEYEDALHRDKYTTELFTMENERLKLAKQDFERERDELMGRIQVLENELQRHNLENKVHKQKTKKLERIVYGKK